MQARSAAVQWAFGYQSWSGAQVAAPDARRGRQGTEAYFRRNLSAMILVKAAKMPQTMPMKKALAGS